MAAKAACSNNNECGCISDNFCDGNEWKIHKGHHVSFDIDGSCAWTKSKLTFSSTPENKYIHTTYIKYVITNPRAFIRVLHIIFILDGCGKCLANDCFGIGGCLLIEGIEQFSCEIDADHFTSKAICDLDKGIWCQNCSGSEEGRSR